jgi:hypothetical protein
MPLFPIGVHPRSSAAKVKCPEMGMGLFGKTAFTEPIIINKLFILNALAADKRR